MSNEQLDKNAQMAVQAEAAKNNPTPEAAPQKTTDEILEEFRPMAEGKVPMPEPKEDLLAGKYKTPEDLEEGYLNLQKKIGDFNGAPEAYVLDNINKDTPHQFDPNDKHLHKFMEYAKEHNMSQDMFDKTLGIYREYVLDMTPKPEEEAKRIGNDALSRSRSQQMWVDENLTPEGKERYKRYMGNDIRDADLFLLMEEIRSANKPIEGPTRFEAQASAQQTIKDIQNEIVANYQRYETDPTYREQKRKQMTEALEYQEKHSR
jgi:hypothetical protein